jgi:hypothetical protein
MSIMTNKRFNELTGKKGKDAAAIRSAVAQTVWQESNVSWTRYILRVCDRIQANTLATFDGSHVEGAFEYMAKEVARRFPLASREINAIGTLAELSGDLVGAALDAIKAGVLTQEGIELGASEATAKAESLATRSDAARKARNFCESMRKLGAISRVEFDTATSYENLSLLVFSEDVSADSFARMLLGYAVGSDISAEAFELIREHKKDVQRDTAKRKATGEYAKGDYTRFERDDLDSLIGLAAEPDIE